MKRLLKFFSLFCISFSIIGCGGGTDRSADDRDSYFDQLPPLIDLEIFFEYPKITAEQISPDGEFISFYRPFGGVRNVWVKDIDEPFESARPITAAGRQIFRYTWSRDGRFILYTNDKDGDENYNLYVVDPRADPEEKTGVPPSHCLIDLEDVRPLILSFPRNTPDYIIIGLNDRDPRFHDVYRLNIETEQKKLLFKNDTGLGTFRFDDDGELRFGSRRTEDGGTEILRISGDELEVVYDVSADEGVYIARIHEDKQRVYMITNKGDDVNLARLVLFDPDTGEETLFEEDPEGEVDLDMAIFSIVTNELLATVYTGDRRRIYFHNEQFEQDFKAIRKVLPDGDIHFMQRWGGWFEHSRRTEDERLWLVSLTRDVDPWATYLYDRETGEVIFQYRSRPELPTEHLAEMIPLRYTARDGLEIPAYLTIPSGIKPENLPVIVLPHGGPWMRDVWEYQAAVQFLANRGYAVFQPNFRGSYGYGKKFLNAGNKEWGGYMQHDITDGVKYLIENEIADPKRVGIYGVSYGGFAALAGLAFTPELYAAGISVVGPSNLITWIESVPPYWNRESLHHQIGDPGDPEDRERLKSQSPFFSAEQIKAPLLVIQGANDPRVPQHESDQIIVALRDLGLHVEYIVLPDEGHFDWMNENQIASYFAIEKFFTKHLGGRYLEDIPADIEKRLEEITVDINEVELAKEFHEENEPLSK